MTPGYSHLHRGWRYAKTDQEMLKRSRAGMKHKPKLGSAENPRKTSTNSLIHPEDDVPVRRV